MAKSIKATSAHMMRDFLLLFPGALGDFLCLWPALQALRGRAAGHIAVVTQPAFADLLPLDDFVTISIHRREVADLFADGPLAESTRRLFGNVRRVHSWTGRGNPNFARRIEAASGGTVSVHPSRGMRPGEHAAQYFARCLEVEVGSPRLVPPTAAVGWAADFWSDHGLAERTLVVHPGSGSRAKNWVGMAEIAAAWRREMDGHVVLLRGPAEDGHNADVSHDVLLRNASLARVAAVLQRACRYLGNDSGISHLAGLIGVPGVVVFGPTDPATWRPLGQALQILTAPNPCHACGPNQFCTHRLPLAAVRDALIAQRVP